MPNLEGTVGNGCWEDSKLSPMTGLGNDNDAGDVLDFLSIWTDRTLTRRWLNPGLYDLKMTQNH